MANLRKLGMGQDFTPASPAQDPWSGVKPEGTFKPALPPQASPMAQDRRGVGQDDLTPAPPKVTQPLDFGRPDAPPMGAFGGEDFNPDAPPGSTAHARMAEDGMGHGEPHPMLDRTMAEPQDDSPFGERDVEPGWGDDLAEMTRDLDAPQITRRSPNPFDAPEGGSDDIDMQDLIAQLSRFRG